MDGVSVSGEPAGEGLKKEKLVIVRAFGYFDDFELGEFICMYIFFGMHFHIRK